MAGKTEYQTKGVIDVLRGVTLNGAANVYVGLFSANLIIMER